MLRIRFEAERKTSRVTDGQAGSFWIGARTMMVVTRRDPAYEGWASDPAGRPSPWPPPPEDALAFDPARFRRAFQVHGIMGSYVAGTWETRAGRTDIAVLHAEHPVTIACWDLPGRFPHLAYDELPVHFPHLVVAQTACMNEDLGEPDDLDPRRPRTDFRGYVCRLGHIHRGQSPYGRELPPAVTARIRASLGEETPAGQPEETVGNEHLRRIIASQHGDATAAGARDGSAVAEAAR